MKLNRRNDKLKLSRLNSIYSKNSEEEVSQQIRIKFSRSLEAT